jgi:signal peptidase II
MHLPGFTEPLLIGAALILFCVLAWNSKKTTLTSIGFGLILGGAIANVIDRLGDGFVTDYIRIGTFPVFNLPDSAITAGVCLLLLEELLKIRTNK